MDDIEKAIAALAKPKKPRGRPAKATPDELPESGGAELTGERTDLANAGRLVEWHGDALRFVAAWNKWLAWDGTRWRADDNGGAERRAQATARRLAGEAQQALFDAMSAQRMRPDDPRAAKAGAKARDLFKWAIDSQSGSRLAATLKLARCNAALAITQAELDRDRHSLNVANGTVDLRTGALRPHARADLNTKLAPCAYDPEALCPTWDAFLLRAMGGDAELVGYLQRLVGYSLTGDTSEQLLAFCYGKGSNGKSTFLGTLRSLFGDYSTVAARGLLFRRKGGGERHPTELASLFGARFVVVPEVEEGSAFDEALIKDLTGGDAISCRRMGEDFWSFDPSHKLWLAGNHRPVVKGNDHGIWRRIKLIPWTVLIPDHEKDIQLPVKLAAEASGILRWAVAGAIEWHAKGLQQPAAVRDASEKYRKESDATGQFFEERMIFGPKEIIVRSELRKVYLAWCEETGNLPLGARALGERLRERGASDGKVKVYGKAVDGWRGLRLATEYDAMQKEAVVSSENVIPFPRSGEIPAYEIRAEGGIGSAKSLLTTGTDEPGGCFDDLLDGEDQ